MNLTLTAVTSLNRILTGLEPYSTQHCIMKGRLHYVCTVVLVTFTRLGDCWSYVATYLDVPASFYLMVCVVPSLLHLMDLWWRLLVANKFIKDNVDLPKDVNKDLHSWYSLLNKGHLNVGLSWAKTSFVLQALPDFGLYIIKIKAKELHGTPIVAKIHQRSSLYNSHTNKLYHSPIFVLQLNNHNKLNRHNKFHLCTNLRFSSTTTISSTSSILYSSCSSSTYPTFTYSLPTTTTLNIRPLSQDSTGLDLKSLGDRLDAALAKKFENIAESLKLSLASTTSSTPRVPRASMTRSTQETTAPASCGGSCNNGTNTNSSWRPTRKPTCGRTYQGKASTPPELVQQAQQPPPDQPSRSSRRLPLNREKRPSRTSRSEPTDGRRRDHPIYRRANVFWQVHQDANTTVYTKDQKDKAKYTYGSNLQGFLKNSSITLRSRSRSRRSKRSSTEPSAIFKRPTAVQLLAKARPEKPPDMEDTTTRETSVSEASESQHVEIPAAADLETVDYRRPSQEREEETDQDEVIRIPKPMSMDEDWRICVQKALADPTRTKAPCEIPANEAITLPQTINKREFEAFQQGLRTRNQKTPQIVIENMASVFAQSGKMNLNQARDSYDFTVPSMKCFGLFAPTHFKPRPPFDGNDSNVYHIIHGTANKGASAILAGELIRPGDFTMRQDPLQCGYPSYGFYSAGEVAAKTIEFSYNIAELSRKILKIGKGTLPVRIILDVMPTTTNWLVEMKKFNVFVENMQLPEAKKSARLPGQKTPQSLEWFFTTKTKSLYQVNQVLLSHLLEEKNQVSHLTTRTDNKSYEMELIFCILGFVLLFSLKEPRWSLAWDLPMALILWCLHAAETTVRSFLLCSVTLG